MVPRVESDRSDDLAFARFQHSQKRSETVSYELDQKEYMISVKQGGDNKQRKGYNRLFNQITWLSCPRVYLLG